MNAQSPSGFCWLNAKTVCCTSMPSGADFPAVFAALARVRYAGNFILQTARAADGEHRVALERYRDMTRGWIAEARRAA